MKSTKAEVRQRVEEVLRIRLMGAEFWDIRQHASENGWGVSDRQLWRYVAQADEMLKESLERDREKLLNRHHAQRRALLARALEVSDLRTALAVVKDEAELLGLYPARRHELTGRDGGPLRSENTVELTDEQRYAGIANLAARLGRPCPGPPHPGAPDPPGPAVGGPGPGADGRGDGAGPLADGPDPLFG
jgi:hypothetical protein